MKHAKLMPASGAPRWVPCAGSVPLSAGQPARRSMPAARGTVAHAISESILIDGHDPQMFLGQKWPVNDDGVCDEREADFMVTVDEELLDAIVTYVGFAREYIALVGPDDWIVEDRVPISHITGEDNAYGTADLVTLNFEQREVTVIDAKFGHHPVDPQTEQLLIYAGGTLHKYGALAHWKTVRCVIIQPSDGGPKEHVYTVAEVNAKCHDIAYAAGRVREAIEYRGHPEWETLYLNPTTNGCRFCPARATCPALRRVVDEVTAQEFDDLTPDALGEAMSKVELVEAWCKEVRAETERRLLAGTPVAGFKLVQGRRGARKWSNPDVVETLMVPYLGERAYDKKLITPATAEKALKATSAWALVAEHITQEEGKPSVAPESDKRDAWTPVSADEFETLS